MKCRNFFLYVDRLIARQDDAATIYFSCVIIRDLIRAGLRIMPARRHADFDGVVATSSMPCAYDTRTPPGLEARADGMMGRRDRGQGWLPRFFISSSLQSATAAPILILRWLSLHVSRARRARCRLRSATWDALTPGLHFSSHFLDVYFPIKPAGEYRPALAQAFVPAARRRGRSRTSSLLSMLPCARRRAYHYSSPRPCAAGYR